VSTKWCQSFVAFGKVVGLLRQAMSVLQIAATTPLLRPRDCGCGAESNGRHNFAKAFPESRILLGRSVTRTRAVAAGGENEDTMPSASSKPPLKTPEMVPPAVAKDIADKDMEKRNKAAAYQRLREIEANNGGWAMLGLTLGVVTEGITRKGILAQIASMIDWVSGVIDAISSALPSS
jgi:hypothetical protein